MTMPARIGAQIGQRVLAPDRVVPDEVVAAVAGTGVAARARHRVGEHHLALGQAEHVAVEQLRVQRWRERRLGDHPTPRHIARELRLRPGRELRANGRADSVRANEQVALQAPSVGEDRGHAAIVLRDARELRVEVVVTSGQDVLQAVVEPGPGTLPLAHVQRKRAAAVALHHITAPDRHADILVYLDAQVLQHGKYLVVRAQASPPAREIVAGFFADLDLPADPAQAPRGKQPAQGPADDDRPARPRTAHPCRSRPVPAATTTAAASS